MDEFHKAAWELAGICRKAINQEVYGGDTPNDSNALTEVWPTAEGAAFTGEHRGQKYMVLVMPEDSLPQPGSLGYPDNSVIDA